MLNGPDHWRSKKRTITRGGGSCFSETTYPGENPSTPGGDTLFPPGGKLVRRVSGWKGGGGTEKPSVCITSRKNLRTRRICWWGCNLTLLNGRSVSIRSNRQLFYLTLDLFKTPGWLRCPASHKLPARVESLPPFWWRPVVRRVFCEKHEVNEMCKGKGLARVRGGMCSKHVD